MSPSPSESAQFHLAEYEALRKEMEAAILETRTLERYAIIGTGGVWAWLATNPRLGTLVAWCIPVLFAGFGGLRAWSLMRSVWRAGRYLMRLEDHLAAASVTGWEHFVRTDRRGFNFETIAVFWLALLAINVVVAVLVLTRFLPVGP